jgi:hypothetical protein
VVPTSDSSVLSFDRQLLDRIQGSGARALVLVGGCGSGRTERLQRLRRALGAASSQYIDFERVALTPERCHAAITARSPFGGAPTLPSNGDARAAFDALLAFFMNARTADGGPASFLVDEILEVRTFESFPGLRKAQTEISRAITHSANRFVLATRFEARARRWAHLAGDAIEVVAVPPLPVGEVRETLAADVPQEADDVAASVFALVGGHAGYVRALGAQMALMRAGGAVDPISAFAAAMGPDGALAARCRFSYELRLHRARGYGALKAILDVLAEDEPLTLTAIAQRLGRTPGSTKDYLTWLQDVDLIACDHKRYRFADPLLRLWVRVHRGPDLPDDDRVIGEAHAYAIERLQAEAPSLAGPARRDVAAVQPADRARPPDSGIIEID